MPLAKPKVAFVAGCNGVSGNAIVEYLIRQPKDEWLVFSSELFQSVSDLNYRSRIVVTSRSPLKTYWQDPRVEFVAIDFLEPVDVILRKMRPFCGGVSHAYFTSYVHTDDFTRLRDLNVPLFENFLSAIDNVAGESLQRVCLQTGGKVRLASLGIHYNSVLTDTMHAELWMPPGPSGDSAT